MRRQIMKSLMKYILAAICLLLLPLGLFSQAIGVIGDSTINKCETKPYTISVQNNSGNPLTSIIVTAKLGNLTGFSYVVGTAGIDVNGGAAFCTVDPTISGTDLIWDIDTQCGGPFTLNNGQTLNVAFSLSTDCAAVSGSLNIRLDYEIGGTPMFDETGAHSIQVLPGGVTIKKTPNVIPQELWQNVTWTLTIENTGFGTIENVVVTDVLGAGLAYVASTPAGSNSGQTTTWGVAEIPGFASMNPGDKITIDITATVIACEFLDNNADVRWGCDLVTPCYDTATTIPPSTATASVQRIVKTPLIQYAPPNVTFNYCEDYVDVNFTITNIGDGRAHDVWLSVDFGSLTVSDVSSGAVYNNTDKRFELTNPLAASPGPGNTFDLSFRLNYNAWCSGFPARDLLWQNVYKDDCDNNFYPPVELSTINPPSGGSSLTVGKSGAPAIVQIGTQITYTITSAYSGPLNCGSGSTGTVTVVDTIPNGFTVLDAGGGTWVPGGGGTGGTITWTYMPPASLNTGITVQVPDRTQCETYCFTTFTNSISATVVDCCGCTLNASASQTTAIECEELVDSEKTAVPAIGIRCSNIQYTNTYTFTDNAALDAVDLSQLVFQENADSEQEYVPGPLQVTLSGAGDITACAQSGMTDTTPGAGGNLSINFANCNTYGSIRNRTLTITYQLRITEATVTACAGADFYSWSRLDLNLTSGFECLPDGVIDEATTVSVDPPAMSLAITGLGQIVHKCQTQTITMTLTQTSATADPKDVRLVLSGLNYYVVDPGATVCSGDVAPTACTPVMVGDDYVWYFGDGFTASGQRSVIQLTVQKRCTGGGDLSAIAYFDDNCNDDGNYDDSCSVTATETPALLLSGDLLIEKNPEVYYATSNTVEWKIYITNRGSGSAYNVWLDDVLGAGLDYVSTVVDNMTGVTITADQDHLGGAINGCTVAISEMTAGQRREITFRALLIDCDNLTNDVSTSWGCGGLDCQTTVSDSSHVEIPRPLLINTNLVTTPADACSSPSGMITLKNAGQTTCYNLQITQTLPAGLTYVSGSTRWRVNGGSWNGPNAAYDPSPSTSPLLWTSTQIAGLDTSNPGDTIEIEYDMAAECPFTGGDVTIATSYENPCGQVFNTADSVFTVAFREPQITVTKTRTNEPIDCGQAIEWTITVQNTSGYTLPIIWVEDVMDAAFTYTSSVGDPPYTSDNGTFNGVNTVSWELRNVNHNDTVTLTLRATTDSAPCSPNLDNTVRAWWGCGAADGSSGTKPGEDPPDNTLCLTTTTSSTVRTETREPSIGFLDIELNPDQINACDDSTELTVTITNTGPTDASFVDLVITLPAGITYNAGTSAVTCGGVAGPAADPVVSGNQLIYYNISNTGSNLCDLVQASGGNDTVTLVFDVRSNCYVTADVGFRLYYYDCCGDTQYDTTASETLDALFPDLSITKTPPDSQVACGANQTWTITVTNNGSGDAQVVRIEDTLGDWIDYISSSPAATLIGGQTYGWEINNLLSGTSASFDITGQLNPDAPQSNCATLLRQDNARAIWGCGTSGDAVDGLPTTTAYDCTYTAWANAPAATLQMPDLVVTAITPAISCTADGTFSGAISVTVRNQGDGIAYGPFQVYVADGTGWTFTDTYGSDLAAGAETTISIDVSSWSPDCSPCTYNFTASVDTGSAVCECREDNNDFGPQAYSPAIPDLEVDTDALAITCVADGQYRISGTVTLRNAGCAGTLTQDVPMEFTLFSGAGCSGAQVAQWNQTFTGVNIPAGATQTFTITNYTIAGNACTGASGCQFSIRSEADYLHVICECDGTDNSNRRCSDKTFTIPDLRVDSETLAISCSADGQIRIQGNLVVANAGCGGNLVTNIPIRIRVYNNPANCLGAAFGTITFNQAGVNIPAGGTQTFAINRTMNRNLCTNSTGCQVALGVELDYTNAICECNGTNNSYCSPNRVVSIPDLQVTGDTLGVTCLQDGQVRVSGTATVANTGCNAAVAGNVPVRFTLFSNINCAGVQLAQWTETFAGANIAAGANQVFTITNRDIVTNICTNSTGCQVSVRIEVDPAPSTICECNGGNNSRCSNKTVAVPDLRITAVTPSIGCTADGSLTGSVQVTVNNNGCGTANNVPVRLASDCGYTFTDQTVAALAAGASTTLTFSFTPDISRCTCVFTATADPDNLVCECDGTNNSLASASSASAVPDLTISDIDFSGIACNSDNISGSVTVTINNLGCGSANNFQVSLGTDGCLGFSDQTVISLAGGASTTLTFNIGGSWADCLDAACQFTATVDSTDAVCEYDGSNNTYSEVYNSTLPDLVVTDIDFTGIACAGDNISGSVSVTIANQGFGNAANFQVSLGTDGCLSFTNQVVANLAAGASTTVTFNISGSWANCADCDCLFTAAVDAANTVCECNGTNNDRVETYTTTLPDLVVNTVSAASTCTDDSNFQGTVTVNVGNTGCGAANNAVVRLTSSCGYVFADQTVNLAVGANANLTFTYTPTCPNCSCTFTAFIDPDNVICECRGNNNSITSAAFDLDVPDITVQTDALTVSCVADGQISVSGTVTLANQGCGSNLTANLPVRFTLYDNTGCTGNVLATWTETLTGVDIPAGGATQAFTITNRTITTNLVTNSTGCRVSLRIEADYNDSICECDGTNNTYCADNKAVDIPDLQVTGDTLGLTCLSDGQVTVSGTVTMTNSGCGSNLVTNIPVRYTLYDNTGCSGNQLSQWTETLAGVNIAAGGGTQVFTITNHNVTTNLVTNSTGCQVSIRVEADYSNTICESDGTDNTYCADNKDVDIPDLQVSTDTLGVTCLADGQVRVSGTVTMLNNGCGTNLAANIPVRFTLYDNTGCAGNQLSQWTETFAGVNITAGGGTQVFSITAHDVTTNTCTNSTGCRVSILIEADYTNSICESDGTDNTRCTDKTIAVPDLTVNSVTPTSSCVNDSNFQGTVTVNVGNTGCGAANNAVVRLTSSCGYVFADQTVNLAVGASANLTFTYTPTCLNCTCTFTAAIDPDDLICECDGTDNTLTSADFNLDVPDVTVETDTLGVTCASDGQISVSGTVTLGNQGCGSNLTADVPVRFTLYDNTGCTGNELFQWSETLTGVNIPAGGGTQAFTIPPYNLAYNLCTNSTNCRVSLRIEADYNDSVCECDGSNNTYCADNKAVDIPDIQVTGDTLAVSCLTDGQVSVSGNVTLSNQGCGANLAANVPVRFTLYGNTGCTGTVLATWTETLTGVDIAPGGGAQTFAISSSNLTANMVDSSTNCRVSIGIQADYNDSICECNGSNNTYCADNKAVDIPDIEVESDALNVTCAADGQATVSGTVTLTNQGCGSNLTADVPVRFTLYGSANCSGPTVTEWTETLTGVNIPVGGSQTFTISNHTFTENMCLNAADCQVSLRIEADYNNTVCESDGTDNGRCSTKTMAIPNLTVNAVATEFVCLNDGSITGVNVDVANTGCGAASGVVVRLTSDCGLTFSDQTVDLAAGETKEMLFLLTAGITDCTCNFTATIDPGNLVCECNGTDNVRSSALSMGVPDLEVSAENLLVACSGDDQVTVSGTVTLQNNGCGPNLTTNVSMRYTLYDGSGCSGNVISQWTETLSGVDITSGGGTQTFTIANHVISPDLCSNNNNCQVSIRIEADYTNSICEWDGTDNDRCTDKTSQCLDLDAVSMTAFTVCLGDGQITGTIALEVANRGLQPISSDFTISITDGEGWNAQLRYQGDLGGTLPLLPGGTASLTIDWTRDFLLDPPVCSFGSMSAVLDTGYEICECSGANNTVDASYALPLPNLVLTRIEPSCQADGLYRLLVRVENNGCGDSGNFTCRMQDDAGHEAVQSVRSLAAGGSITIEFSDWPVTCSTFKWKAVLDPENRVCERTADDNGRSVTLTLPEPDLALSDAQWKCNVDGTVTITFTVANLGPGQASGVVISAVDDAGNTLFEQTADFAAGQVKPFTFTLTPTSDQPTNVRIIADAANLVCECSSGNNEALLTYTCKNGFHPEPKLEIDKLCQPGTVPGGLLRFEIVIENTGNIDLVQAVVEDTLPDSFQYVAGSAVLDGNSIPDPTPGPPLVFTIGTLKKGMTYRLIFLAAVDSDIDPGRYCNQALVRASYGALEGLLTDLEVLVSDSVECCTVIDREIGAGCCLRVEEIPVGAMRLPEAAVSLVEPYFQTSAAMFTAYAALGLWPDDQFGDQYLPGYVKERLKNYALSTIEEYYFKSQLGYTLNDGSLWLGCAGAVPEMDKQAGWTWNKVVQEITPAQVGFEIMALERAIDKVTDSGKADKLRLILAKKREFVSGILQKVPESWEITTDKPATLTGMPGEKELKTKDKAAPLYDQVVLYLSLLKSVGPDSPITADMLKKQRSRLREIDEPTFSAKRLREELFFLLSLLQNKEAGLASQKMAALKNQYLDGRLKFEHLFDQALAVFIAGRTDWEFQQKLYQSMIDHFLDTELGVFSEKRADFTSRIELDAIGAVLLALDSRPGGERDKAAIFLYRMFDDVGLFLKKNNLLTGKPLLPLIDHRPFTFPYRALFSLSKAQETVVPVFTQQAATFTSALAPGGEILIPEGYARMLPSEYETSISGVASISLALQHLGKNLLTSSSQALQEEGRSLFETGKRYLESTLFRVMALQGSPFLPEEALVVKSSPRMATPFEPVDRKTVYATETLSGLMAAEQFYMKNNGKKAADVKEIFAKQVRILEEFLRLGFVPAQFQVDTGSGSGSLTIVPGQEPADKMTLSRLILALADNPQMTEFLRGKLAGKAAALKSTDLVLFSVDPGLIPFFKDELETLRTGKTETMETIISSLFSHLLLGKEVPDKLVKKLLALWELEYGLPSGDAAGHSTAGKFTRYQPLSWAMYLLTRQKLDDKAFAFERTLNVFTQVLENNWGVPQGTGYLHLPPHSIDVLLDAPRQWVEAGDVVTFKVRVDNLCPQGFGIGRDVSPVWIKALFDQPLQFLGFKGPDGLSLLDAFSWTYESLIHGDFLEYFYQAAIPLEYQANTISGWIRAAGSQAAIHDVINPEIGKQCDDLYPVRGLSFVPVRLREILVFEDLNLNGIQDAGEKGIPTIQWRDSRNRIYRSDAEGRAYIPVSEAPEAIQIDLDSLPPAHVLLEPPTRVIDTLSEELVSFAVVPCRTVEGFIYLDANGNGTFDSGEQGPSGIILQARGKEVSSGKDGVFVFYNLPIAWEKDIQVKTAQPFFTGDTGALRFNIRNP